MNPKEAMVRITEGLALLLRQNDEGATHIVKTCYELELWAFGGKPIRSFSTYKKSVVTESLAVVGDFDGNQSLILGSLLAQMKELSNACRGNSDEPNLGMRGIVFDSVDTIASYALALDIVIYGAEGWKDLAHAGKL